MDIFKLYRDFWDFAFEHPEKIKPNHIAIYSFAIEHCNRLGWKGRFGLPTSMVMDAIGLRSYNTYIKSFNELVEFGFFSLVEKSKNQYSSNIIALSNFNKAQGKALDKAMIKHASKQVESTHQSTGESNDSIIKPIYQYTNKQEEEIKKEFSKNEIFGFESLKKESWVDVVTMQNNISKDDLPNWIEKFNIKLATEMDTKKYQSDYVQHFVRWLPQEIAKLKKEEIKVVQMQNHDAWQEKASRPTNMI